jgi:hypothetical protein
VFFALEATGLVLVAVGSVILALVDFPAWWFVGATLGGTAGLVYALVVWKQHQYRASRRDREHTTRWVDEADDAWHHACLDRCATWRWSLRHPFESEPWPRDCYELPGAPPG